VRSTPEPMRPPPRPRLRDRAGNVRLARDVRPQCPRRAARPRQPRTRANRRDRRPPSIRAC